MFQQIKKWTLLITFLEFKSQVFIPTNRQVSSLPLFRRDERSRFFLYEIFYLFIQLIVASEFVIDGIPFLNMFDSHYHHHEYFISSRKVTERTKSKIKLLLKRCKQYANSSKTQTYISQTMLSGSNLKTLDKKASASRFNCQYHCHLSRTSFTRQNSLLHTRKFNPHSTTL